MKRYLRLFLLGVLVCSLGLQFVSAQNRNKAWISDSDIPDTVVEAGDNVEVGVNVSYELDYDTEILVSVWSEDDGYYVEQVTGTFSGVGSKNYYLMFWASDINGVHKYRVDVLYQVGDEEYEVAEDGSVEFELEVTGGESSNPIQSFLDNASLPSLPSINIPNLSGATWAIVGAVVVLLIKK